MGNLNENPLMHTARPKKNKKCTKFYRAGVSTVLPAIAQLSSTARYLYRLGSTSGVLSSSTGKTSKCSSIHRRARTMLYSRAEDNVFSCSKTNK